MCASRCRRPVGLLLLLLLLPFALRGQQPVALCTDWLATVDSASQQLELRWVPAPGPAVAGYHVCTGDPCLSLGTVLGGQATGFRPAGLDPGVPHRFRVHAFDSLGNVSALTPFFGGMVLTAAVDPCDTVASVSWTPYVGMPGGLDSYRLLARFDPFDSLFRPLALCDSLGPLTARVGFPASATGVSLVVEAASADGRLVARSAMVQAVRATADTARFFGVTDALYDSASRSVTLAFSLDTAFRSAPYRLLFSRAGGDFQPLAVVDASGYVDRHVNPYDSLRCYLLAVADGCGLHERRSPPRCVDIPRPPDPLADFPNVLLAGDPDRGRFLPRVQGLMGDLFELRVFDRQGRQHFASDSPSLGWDPDATHSPQGSYVYLLRVRFINNSVRTYTGTITVIR